MGADRIGGSGMDMTVYPNVCECSKDPKVGNIRLVSLE